MKRNVAFLLAFLIMVGVSGQNKKVAVFDMSGTDDESLIKDVRNTYYWALVDCKGLDAVSLKVVNKVLSDENYRPEDDIKYKEIAKLASKMGAQLALLSKVEKNGSTFIIETELIDARKCVVVSTGKGVHQYKFFAIEKAFDKLLSNFKSIIRTPSYSESGWGNNFSETVADVRFEMIFVKGGTFAMGSDIYSIWKNEKPVHDVFLDSYYIGKTEVTFALFDAFCEETGAIKPSDETWGRGNHPVINIGKNDALKFCKWLSQKTGMDYRLPTEAEWEYAARGGIKSTNKIYAGSDNLYSYAWFDRNSNGKSHPVGLKLPNELGIYDMCGNVLEICNDWFKADYYKSSPKNNPQGPKEGRSYVVRGGSHYDCPNSSRIAFRRFGGSGRNSCAAYLTGFRLVCNTTK